MINKLKKFQDTFLSIKSKRTIKSIESGLFTGIRDNLGNIKLKYIKHYNKNIIKYNLLLKEINKINYKFFKNYPEYKNEYIILYRGIKSKLNDKYIDIIPTSFTFKKRIAYNFLLDDSTLLKYKCYDKKNIIINFTNDILNEYEIILPPCNYNIIKKSNKFINCNHNNFNYNIKFIKYLITK